MPFILVTHFALLSEFKEMNPGVINMCTSMVRLNAATEHKNIFDLKYLFAPVIRGILSDKLSLFSNVEKNIIRAIHFTGTPLVLRPYPFLALLLVKWCIIEANQLIRMVLPSFLQQNGFPFCARGECAKNIASRLITFSGEHFLKSYRSFNGDLF